MRQEALETPEVIARQNHANVNLLQDITARLRALNPYTLTTIARGSSDHAAQYLNFLAMTKLGKLTTSLSLSALTLYRANLDVNHTVGIAISQSGQSPDVYSPVEYFRSRQAPTIALVNDTQSPLAKTSEFTVPLYAGPEKAVAATKSFLASLSASAALIAHWSADQQLLNALELLPENLRKAQTLDWTVAIEPLSAAKRIMTVGRGLGLSLALEAALKFKETCGIQAEAFSAAEIKHGPQTLIEEGYPLIFFALPGPALTNIIDLAEEMRQRGARVILAAPATVPRKELEVCTTGYEQLDVICAAQSFYLFVEQLSRHLGMNPDQPRHLAKVTKTT